MRTLTSLCNIVQDNLNIMVSYKLTVRSFFRRFLRIVPYVTCFETEKLNKGTSVAQRFERITSKSVCFEPLKSSQVPLRRKMLELGLSCRHQVGESHYFVTVFLTPSGGNNSFYALKNGRTVSYNGKFSLVLG